MRRRTSVILVLGLVSVLGGCYPEKRVAWSPDGRRAAVIGGDGFYFCDEHGKLSARLANDVRGFVWFTDSRRLALVRTTKVDTWAAAAVVLGPDRQQRLRTAVDALRTEILAHTGPWEEFKPTAIDALSSGERAAALLLLREQHADELYAKLGDQSKLIRDAEATIWSLQVADVAGEKLQLGPVLASFLDQVMEPRVAPDGQYVAWVGPLVGAAGDSTRLFIAPADGAQPARGVAENVSWFPDWTADSRALVFAAANGKFTLDEDAVRLGVIARRAVRDADGRLLSSFPEPEELAGMLFQREARVRCLKDGRVLFATVEVHLPCTPRDLPKRGALFCVDSGRQPTVARVMPRQAEAEVGNAIFYFEVSPDERQAVIPGADGEVTVLTFATGDVWEVPGKQSQGNGLRTVPVWRSADELCFAGIACDDVQETFEASGGDERETARVPARLELVKLDWDRHVLTRRTLSSSWPEGVSDGFLTLEKRTEPAGADAIPAPAGAAPRE